MIVNRFNRDITIDYFEENEVTETNTYHVTFELEQIFK